MAKKEVQELQKVTLRLFKGDKEILDRFYRKIGHNKAIRLIVRKHTKDLEEKLNQNLGDNNE